MSDEKDKLIQEATSRAHIPPEKNLAITHPMTVHIIPQSHIDLVWYWKIDETVRMVLNTFRGHVEKLIANPDYTFAQSQATAYDIVLRHDPELFEQVRSLVARGQWEPVGGEWCEADTFLPGPEARLRQFFFGQRFFHEHFGRTSTAGWCPDSFIMQPGSLPQVLRGAGIDYFVHKRPRELYGHCPMLPYIWMGQDGSSVVAFRVNNKGAGLYALSDGTDAPPDKGDMAVIAETFEKAGLAHLWGAMGVGDIGGVNDYETPQTSDLLKCSYSTPEKFFSELTEQIDTSEMEILNGSMAPVCSGSLTTWAQTKTLNRSAENGLLQVEAVMAMAEALGIDTDIALLDPAWKRLLFYQFHDSIGGCGTDPVRLAMEHALAEVELTARNQLSLYMRQIAESVETDQSLGLPVVVFNPLGHSRSDVVEARVSLPENLLQFVPQYNQHEWGRAEDCREFQLAEEELEAVDEDGNIAPVMVCRYILLQKIHVAHVRFLAADVPGFGYKTFYLRPRRKTRMQVSRKDRTFTTSRLKAIFNTEAGGIRSLEWPDHQGLDFTAAGEPIGQLRIVHTGDYPIDYGVELRAWNTGFTGREESLNPVRHEVKKYSGGRWEVVFHYEYAASRFRQSFLIEPDVPFVEVTLSGDWQEVEKYLKIQFAFASNSRQTAFADQSYGFTESLPDGLEYPMQYLCGLGDGDKALVVLNNSRYGCRWKDGSLSVSAIRCASFPAPVSDRGEFLMTYRIAAVKMSDSQWRRRMVGEGFGFNCAFATYAPEWSSRRRPTEWGILEADVSEAVASCIKPAHAGNGLIMRLFNPSDSAAKETITTSFASRVFEERSFLELHPEDREEIALTKAIELGPLKMKTIFIQPHQ